VYSPAHIPFSSSSPLLGARDILRHRKEIGHSPQHNISFLSASDYNFKGDTGSISSHLILKDSLEEPQVCDFCFLLITHILLEFLLLSTFFILFVLDMC
jgi:hypothetical protein